MARVTISSISEKPASLRFMFGSLPRGFQDAHVPSPVKSGLAGAVGRKSPWVGGGAPRRPQPVGWGYAPTYGASPGGSEEHTSELQTLMRISIADFCLKTKNANTNP